MNKICGYSCEHNKNGICQISVCSKKSNMKDKTETELFRETWYEISQIRQLQQENKQLKEKINKTIRLLEIQIEVIKEQPSDNSANDNMEIKQREKVINLLNEVSE